MRSSQSQHLDPDLDRVAAAVHELLPAPLSDTDQSWGVQPHCSSSSWMATWRVWRSVASALHLSGIVLPSLAHDVLRPLLQRLRSSSLLIPRLGL